VLGDPLEFRPTGITVGKCLYDLLPDHGAEGQYARYPTYGAHLACPGEEWNGDVSRVWTPSDQLVVARRIITRRVLGEEGIGESGIRPELQRDALVVLSRQGGNLAGRFLNIQGVEAYEPPRLRDTTIPTRVFEAATHIISDVTDGLLPAAPATNHDHWSKHLSEIPSIQISSVLG
jgi:hypothetical protein